MGWKELAEIESKETGVQAASEEEEKAEVL